VRASENRDVRYAINSGAKADFVTIRSASLAQEVLPIKFIDKKFRLRQIEGLKPLREPIVDRHKKLTSVVIVSSIAPQPRQARCRPQFPGFCLLLLRDSERPDEVVFRLVEVGIRLT
jgi:hypothetical protein